MSLWYLQLHGKHALVIAIASIGVLVGTLGTVFLVRHHGPFGALWGFALINAAVLLPMQAAAWRLQKRLRRSDPQWMGPSCGLLCPDVA